MSLKQITLKIKSFREKINWNEVFLIITIVLIICLAYGVALIQNIEKPEEVQIINGLAFDFSVTDQQNREVGGGKVIAASKNGTKYYFLHCSGLSRIKKENLVYFDSEKEAQKNGFKLAKGCK